MHALLQLLIRLVAFWAAPAAVEAWEHHLADTETLDKPLGKFGRTHQDKKVEYGAPHDSSLVKIFRSNGTN